MVDLGGARILVVEDETAISELLEAAIQVAGGIVVGPAIDVSAALALIAMERISAAVVDMIVHGIYADAIAIELARRGIPFAVTTGIGADVQHPKLRDAPTITKPFQAAHVQELLHFMMAEAENQPSSDDEDQSP